MGSSVFESLPIDDVVLDTQNPRIRRFLEFYEEGTLSDEHIGLALNAPSADNPTAANDATTANRLRESILANGGIRQPIIVNKISDGTLVCIEGNTRLWLYRDLREKGASGNWSTIPALVHDSLENDSIDAIRLQAHLVGPRPWDAYSKARYLHELQNISLMSLSRIVALCGGNQRDVTMSIQAYADMEKFYRPLCEPGEFDVGRFSGFVEYRKPKVLEAILMAGFSGTDFSQWIKDRKIGPLQDVRQLPLILKDKQARQVFLAKGMKAALQILDRPDTKVDLQHASLPQITRALVSKANRTSMEELRTFKEDDGETLRHIEAALDSLRFLQDQIVGEN